MGRFEAEAAEQGRFNTGIEHVCYVDESARSRDRLYVVAAALTAQNDDAVALETLRSVPPGRSQRFHWRLEREPSRIQMLAAIRTLRFRTLAACYCTDRPRWSQRGRTQALKGLLWRLQGERVARLVIETRGLHGDAEDRRTIHHAQRSGHADANLYYCFDTPANPFLWVADAIAGAVTSAFADGIDRYLDQLGDARPSIIDVGP
jgi:hypothetical protein